VKRVVGLVLIAGCLATAVVASCRSWTQQVLRFQDGKFTVTETVEDGATCLQITGWTFHSGLVIDHVDEVRRGDTLIVSVVLVLAGQEGLTGHLDHRVVVPPGVVRVVFGREEHEIWHAPP